MRSPASLALFVCLSLVACNDRDRPDGDGGGFLDGGAAMDAPPTIDSGPRDAGQPDAGPGECNPEVGIECDGDWEGRCSETCAAEQCCSPYMGAFSCRDRVDGRCPAADIW